jgi:CHAT domain-containing protein
MIKVLFLAANPTQETRLNLEKEHRTILEKLRASDFRDSVTLESRWALRPDDLLQSFQEVKPHVVHFSGHGSQDDEIILETDGGGAKPVSKGALTALFTTLRDNIRVVVLNACFSRGQAEALTQVVDCVVGMRQEVSDDAAIVFAASFYRGIGFGRSVQNAFEQGRTALMLEGIPEEWTPELLTRQGVDASEVVLVNPR